MNKPNFMKYLNFHVETIVSKINLHNAQNFNNLNMHISRLTAGVVSRVDCSVKSKRKRTKSALGTRL